MRMLSRDEVDNLPPCPTVLVGCQLLPHPLDGSSSQDRRG